MAQEMDEVCKELDDTLLEVMETLKQLSSLRSKYKQAVKEGYLLMSQARHAMGGPNSVCSLQYDSGMKALARLTLETNLTPPGTEISSYDSDGLITPTRDGEQFHAEFRIQRLTPGKVQGKCGPEKVESVETEIRKRKGQLSSEVSNEVTPAVEEVKGLQEMEEETGLKDPLKWFGILVPQTLRQSQQCFMQVVQYCADLAAAQMKFQVAHRKYQQLLLKKKTLTLT